MVATTPPSPSRPGNPTAPERHEGGTGERFDRTERAVHWSTALLVLTLVTTGAILYIPSLSVCGGAAPCRGGHPRLRRPGTVRTMLAGVVGRWGANLRADLRQMRGLTGAELAWLHSLGRRGRKPSGSSTLAKNSTPTPSAGYWSCCSSPGSSSGGAISYLSACAREQPSSTMCSPSSFVVVIGHIAFAITHPHALRSMVTGRVPAGGSAAMRRRGGAPVRAPCEKSPRPVAETAF